MSAAEIIKELPRLTAADRQELLDKLVELVQRDEEIAACNHSAAEGAAQLDRLEDTGSPSHGVDLRKRGVSSRTARPAMPTSARPRILRLPDFTGLSGRIAR
jgi:hypothetical protein